MSIKLVVLYPYPKDQESLRTRLYNRTHSHGRQETHLLYESDLHTCPDVTAGGFPFLSDCRVALPHPGSIAGRFFYPRST